METVTVLLSTYNGEKYLRHQIDSILNQIGVKVIILARDDGSTDNTLNILEEYAGKNENFSYYIGNNIGPSKSFFELMKSAEKNDFYAFCDQDDIWDNDKLKISIKFLNKLPCNIPNLYYSNLRIVDENLKFYRLSHQNEMYNKNKFSALTENLCTGCTAVFNYSAMDLIRNNFPSECTMHDTWIYMVCMIMGNVVYDKEPHISYRQHSSNVIGTYLKKSKKDIYLVKFKRLFNKNLQPRYLNATNFYKSFSEYLNEFERKKVLKIVNYKKNLYTKIDLLLDRDIKSSSFYGNIRLILHIIWGTF